GGVAGGRAGGAEARGDAQGALEAVLPLQLPGPAFDRSPARLLQRRGAAKLAVVFFRLPRLPVPADRVRDRRIFDTARRREPGFERGDVDERLECRARLPPRLHGAVEFAAEEVVAADHRAHVAGLRLACDDRPLPVL